MWIFTGYGAYFPSQRPAGTIPEGDNQHIQIRARRRIELERLKAFYPEIPTGEIIYFPHTDYEYRMYCTHSALGMLLALMAADIDYTKFKPTTETFGETELHHAYNRIWGILYTMFSKNKYLEQQPPREERRKKGKKNRDSGESPLDPVRILKRGNRRNPQYNWEERKWD